VPIYTAFYAASENSLIDLIQRKQSWGEHARRVKAEVTKTEAELVAEGRRIDGGLQQSHEAELQRRQAASAAFLQYSQTQQIINAINRPVVTNCNSFGTLASNSFGATTNCVTH
jgi:hypothetical protein